MTESAKQEQAGQVATTEELGGFRKALKGAFTIKSEAQETAVVAAVEAFAGMALANTALLSDDALRSIEAMIAQIDKKLSAQIDLIIHNEEFQKLEGAWRGLHHLVNNTETDEKLQIRVMNISKKDLGKELKRYKGARWDQSPLFKKIYEAEYGQLGGTPYGALVGDYYFDHSAPDVELLGEMAKIAAASHAPFISAAAPSLLNMDSWLELSNPADITALFNNAEYAAWKSLRESDDSRYLGLAMPRVLSRLPYSVKNNPVDEFTYDEDVEGADHSKFCWMNAAYGMALNINQAFKFYGWCSRIRGVESGGTLTDMKVHTFPTDDGGVDMKCPTEIAISDRREAELAKNGLMPLLHRKGTDQATFIGAQSLHRPQEFTGPDGAYATANANLSARLPYMFAVCRFSHYLKCMIRDWCGRYTSQDVLQGELTQWINNFIEPRADASEDAKARRPLAEAQVEVVENEANPGYYNATFRLKPHYQLEGVNVSMRLVAKMKAGA